MKLIHLYLSIVLLSMTSCRKYLDVVPDNIATIDNAFTLRSTAEKFLFTCYSYLPDDGERNINPAFMGADEMWHYLQDRPPIIIARGEQNIVNPANNYWQGQNSASPLFQGIRTCNIFLDNIGKVEELDGYERDRWIAEVKFLKAYYHFYLLRMYGPIPLIKNNIDVGEDLDIVNQPRESVDDCVNYIVQLLDESLPNLPENIQAEATELGRITKGINLSIKARLLVMAASPLFNGNTEYSFFKNADGLPYFNQVFDPAKWQLAADACKAAIDMCHANGNKLYYYIENDPNALLASAHVNVQMNIRNAVTAKWNPEVVWGNPNSLANDLQIASQARLDQFYPGLASINSELSPTLKMAEMFYSKNGVPINEDVTYNYAGRYNLQTAVSADKFYIKEGYETAILHFNREPRFYADLGFDGGIWYGAGNKTETNNWYVQAKLGQYSAKVSSNRYSITGYWPKKLVNPDNVYSATVAYTVQRYPWPQIRLADIYLLYAEALNEVFGPTADVYEYVNLVRRRAGLETVQSSWSQFSNNPDKFTTKTGMRDIIRRERTIEMAFEGQRFWDLRRWKEAPAALNSRVQGWDLSQADAATYYRVQTIYNQTFKTKDYFWPIPESEIIKNKKLVQNPGW